MTIEKEIRFREKTYQITIEDDFVEPPVWMEVKSCLVPSGQIKNELDRRFLDQYAAKLLQCWGNDHLESFLSLLHDMGASVEELHKLGLDFLVETEDSRTWFFRSPIHAMGYKVGKSGISEDERHAILREAFLGTIPNVGAEKYMVTWGLPGSEKRLAAIAHHIRFKCRGNPTTDLSVANADWQSDLKWLKATFYDGHFTFPWI